MDRQLLWAAPRMLIVAKIVHLTPLQAGGAELACEVTMSITSALMHGGLTWAGSR